LRTRVGLEKTANREKEKGTLMRSGEKKKEGGERGQHMSSSSEALDKKKKKKNYPGWSKPSRREPWTPMRR